MSVLARRMLRSCLVGVVLAGVAQGCASEEERQYTLRAIEPSAGSLSTAMLERVEIDAETRMVLAAPRRDNLRWREPVILPLGELSVKVVLPERLRSGRQVRLDAWVSFPDAELRELDLIEQRLSETSRRETLRAESIVLDTRVKQMTEPVLSISIPKEAEGLEGLLSVVAWPLTSTALERQETRVFKIPAHARLEFGFAIAEPGWAAGWPPVHLRVRAHGADVEYGVLFERRLDPALDPRDRRWFDASVGLGDLAGEEVRFVFEAEAIDTQPDLKAVRSFPVISSPEVLISGARAQERPNVILVSLDTLRARNVSAYGYERETTPNLDRRVAERGALVRSVVVPMPFTPPSHMTMLTGLEPCVHGVVDRHAALAPERITLAEILRAEGYQTAAFTENAYLVAQAGFARGFDLYREERSEASAAPGFAVETFDAGQNWLSARATEPFFLLLHTYQVHGPYRPPRAYAQTFGSDEGELANYDREIRYTDDLIAGFLDVLDQRGLSERTILVVTSDHGEAFLEHPLTKAHGSSVYDEELLVPLLVRAPGLVPSGQIVDRQVGLVDLVPTLLDLSGIEVPSGVEFQGESFAPELRGSDRELEETPRVSRALTPQESVRTSRYKYIRWSKERDGRLFLLPTDPLEKLNLVKQHPELVAEAEAVFVAHERACEDYRERHPASEGGATGPSAAPAWMINRDEIDRKLRSLGYVE